MVSTLVLPDPDLTAVDNTRPTTTLVLTSKGQLKKRTTWNDKLLALDPASPPEVTEGQLERFAKLFVQRFSNGITTRVGKGPRSWTAFPGNIGVEQVCRHLLGERIPTLPVIWFGVRSFESTRWIAIDVDIDRQPNSKPEQKRRRKDHEAGFPSFGFRRQYLEQVLRGLGLNPGYPPQVLQQPSPSGGRHYYIFFDKPYPIQRIKKLLEQAGIQFLKGRYELFPSPNQGFRLPFGHIPGQATDPYVWIHFVNDYHNFKIRRYSLPWLEKQLTKPPVRIPADLSGQKKVFANLSLSKHKPVPVGIPKRFQGQPGQPRSCPQHPKPYQPQKNLQQNLEWYSQTVELGPKTIEDAERLWRVGILAKGTRNSVLNHLAAHLIWHKGLAPAEAAQKLTAWALDPRQESVDIHQDLANGTNRIADQIQRMIGWYAAHQHSDIKRSSHQKDRLFSPKELEVLKPHMKNLPQEERSHQAQFMLLFLAFARRHGQPAPDSKSWTAAVAINTVVKKWPGCRHGNDYKKRFQHAGNAGLLAMIKEKWQNKNGRGRARTYHLAIPVVPDRDQKVEFEAALKYLAEGLPFAVPEEKPKEENKTNEHDPNATPTDSNAQPSVYPAFVHSPCAGGNMGKNPSQCPPVPSATRGLRRQTAGECPTLSPINPAPYQINDFQDHERRRFEATRRQGVGQRGNNLPKTLDNLPLLLPHDRADIAKIIANLETAISEAFAHHNAENHPTWALVAEIAQSPQYTLEQRRLILSNLLHLSGSLLEARKKLIRDHRAGKALASGDKFG